MVKKFKGLSMNKSFRRHHKKFTELRRLWRKVKQGHWWNGGAILKVSILRWTTKNLLKFCIKCQMKNKVSESKAQQSLRLWMRNSQQSNLKNYKKLWSLIQSCLEKYSSIEISLDPVKMQFGPYPKFKDIINDISENKRPIKTWQTCRWIYQNQEQNSEWFSLRTIRWAINEWRFWKNIQANNWTTTIVIWRNCFKVCHTLRSDWKYAGAASIALGHASTRIGRITWSGTSIASNRIGRTSWIVAATLQCDGHLNVGPIARKYLAKLTRKKGDETFGPKCDDKGNFKLGDAEFETDGNDVIINGEKYKGTEDLWELVTLKEPKTGAYDDEDMKKYVEIMVSTNAMKNLKDPNRPAANNGYKRQEIIEPIWVKYVKKTKQMWRKSETPTEKNTRSRLSPKWPKRLVWTVGIVDSFKTSRKHRCSERNWEHLWWTFETKKICLTMLTLNKDVNY